MFSTNPMMGTLIFACPNIAIAFLASARATVCGVVTITTPVTGTVCIIVKCISPVPGGISITK